MVSAILFQTYNDFKFFFFLFLSFSPVAQHSLISP